jgi:hypothetical protein
LLVAGDLGEPPEIYPFFGSSLLAEAVDAGMTPGGVPVRNVAQPVIRAAYKTFTLEP